MEKTSITQLSNEVIPEKYSFEVENLEEKQQIAKEIHKAKDALNDLIARADKLGLDVSVFGGDILTRPPQAMVSVSLRIGKTVRL